MALTNAGPIVRFRVNSYQTRRRASHYPQCLIFGFSPRRGKRRDSGAVILTLLVPDHTVVLKGSRKVKQSIVHPAQSRLHRCTLLVTIKLNADSNVRRRVLPLSHYFASSAVLALPAN